MRAIAVYVDQLHGELDELHRQLNARRGAYGSSLSTVKLTAQAFKQFEKSVDLIDGKVLSPPQPSSSLFFTTDSTDSPDCLPICC